MGEHLLIIHAIIKRGYMFNLSNEMLTDYGKKKQEVVYFCFEFWGGGVMYECDICLLHEVHVSSTTASIVAQNWY